MSSASFTWLLQRVSWFLHVHDHTCIDEDSLWNTNMSLSRYTSALILQIDVFYLIYSTLCSIFKRCTGLVFMLYRGLLFNILGNFYRKYHNIVSQSENFLIHQISTLLNAAPVNTRFLWVVVRPEEKYLYLHSAFIPCIFLKDEILNQIFHGMSFWI